MIERRGSDRVPERREKFGWDALVEFAQQNLDDPLAAPDRSPEFPRQAWRRSGEYGVLGLPLPAEYGGQNEDAKTTARAMEAIGYGCRDNGLLAAINAHMWSCVVPIWKFGSEAQKRHLLPRLCNGEWVAAHAATEPEAGSDIFSLKTRAERRGNKYILNGQKTFILNAPVADWVVVFATIDPDQGPEGITGFVVENGTPGMTVSRVINKVGLRHALMGEIVFTNCEIPAENRLGPEGNGSLIFQHSMHWERTLILAPHVGTMRRVLEKCIQYARRRRQFGQSIGKFQSISNRIADMKVRVECARLLLYHAADILQQKTRQAPEASMAKLFISEAAVETYLNAIQIHGALGYTDELEFGEDLRDAIGTTIFSGTSDINRQIIARHLGL
jgi:alkylation response protein AidB-like acyl-CoA dehydrogenase